MVSSVSLHPSVPVLTERWAQAGGVVLFQISLLRLSSQLSVLPLPSAVSLEAFPYCQPAMSRLDMTKVRSICQFKYSAQVEGRT